MTLQSSGPISLGNCNTEFALGSSSPLSALYGKGGAPASGALALSDFYGRSNVTISADTTFVYRNGYSQSGSANITCASGFTIASITLIAGSANPRINPGSAGGASTTGTVTTPATGTNVISATYRYTCSTNGQYVDVEYTAEWGT